MQRASIFMLLMSALGIAFAQNIPAGMEKFGLELNNGGIHKHPLHLENMRAYAALPKETRNVLESMWQRNPECWYCSNMPVIGGNPIVINPLPSSGCAKDQHEGMVLVSREWLDELTARARHNSALGLPR